LRFSADYCIFTFITIVIEFLDPQDTSRREQQRTRAGFAAPHAAAAAKPAALRATRGAKICRCYSSARRRGQRALPAAFDMARAMASYDDAYAACV